MALPEERVTNEKGKKKKEKRKRKKENGVITRNLTTAGAMDY